MKLLLYRFLKSMVYSRFKTIEQKKRERYLRLQECVKQLREWRDIPVSFQYTSLCKVLKIKPSRASETFIYGLMNPRVDLKQEVKKLPLI